ncbi:hypothetical protein P3T18_003167 [Paraburkholderia sp. GAS199]|uniref:hypothetical protein n=1 Tax=Paraburkholderia sp. GAS199 TaxID=3035126 RepID=UPI003D23C1A5
MNRGEKLLYALGKYSAPGLLACYALIGLYRAFVEGGALICSGGRYQHCQWVWADMDPEQIQSTITLDWWLLAASVVLAFVFWRFQPKREDDSRE